MSLEEFLLIYACCLATMLACRCIPIFVLKGRDLPDRLQEALNLIPPAAFAALVANDLFKPTMFAGDITTALFPLIAAAIVVVVARQSRSLVWCAIAGVVSYAILVAL